MKSLVNIIAPITKILFAVSASLFFLAYFMTSWWIPELVTCLTIFQTLSTMVFIGLFCYLRSKLWTTFGILLAVLQVVFIITTYLKSKPLSKPGNDEVITMVQFNVRHTNKNTREVVDWLEANHARFDAVFLQEVNMNLKSELERLKKYYPYYVLKADRWFCRAFFSKIPIINHRTEFFNNLHGHFMNIDLKTKQNKVIKFYGLHTTSPKTSVCLDIRNQELTEITELFSQDPAKYKIIAGDLNTTPFSKEFRKMLATKDINRPRVHSGSWHAHIPLNILQMQIDHFLVSNKIDYVSQERGPSIGSDHNPIITTIVLRD